MIEILQIPQSRVFSLKNKYRKIDIFRASLWKIFSQYSKNIFNKKLLFAVNKVLYSIKLYFLLSQ